MIDQRFKSTTIVSAVVFILNVGIARGAEPTRLELVSSAFDTNGPIPTLYTCEGKDKAPPLAWTGVPNEAKTLALIVEDPDAPDPRAPKSPVIHWVVYNMPATTADLPEGADPLPLGTLEGVAKSGHTSYGGPCPPIGQHRYFFKLYALDTVLSFSQPPTKSDLEGAMQGHIVGQGVLIGTYAKKSGGL